MENVLSHLRHLSSEVLRDEAKKAGISCGPITKSTRSLWEKKLARLIVAKGQEGTYEAHHGDGEQDMARSENGTMKKIAEAKIIKKEDRIYKSGGPVVTDGVPEENEAERLEGLQADLVSIRQKDLGEIENMGRKSSKDIGEEENVKKGREHKTLHTQSLMEGVAVTKENDSSISPPSGLFYGVCPAPGTSECGIGGTKGVYTDRTLALSAVRALPGSRFKAFSSWEEAHDFASCSMFIANSPNCCSIIERGNSFSTPRVQDLTTKLRRAAERGDIDELDFLAWNNPCYLIGPGDVPTIVHEGCHYNTLHVAAKAGQADFIHHLLSLISLPAFLALAFPTNSSVSREQRATRLTDLYLNTPEKGKFNTPLHLAAEFGHLAVVQLLLSHPSLVWEPRNRWGSTPLQVICSRREGASESLRGQLKQCFEGQVFVPLLRAEENTIPPVIAPPCSPSHNFNPLSPTRTTPSRNPCKPCQQLQAFAGPMSPAKEMSNKKGDIKGEFISQQNDHCGPHASTNVKFGEEMKI
uniref:ankyrin repeat and LEM domain-containing protein 2-like n=1 Tax=Myxine glutinosa TaxID=7769 RepID=UPI00358E6A95